ncbi:MAG TPA: TetR/AcrR family transcriptional regulator [Polyangiales bacterium]|nr:TetR/AcrR family transcriptional regulator [Polyangiales bacterium]
MRANAPRVRRTQEERSRATRNAILDATLSCLIERGYAGTSTPQVCRRARVSRGAMLHHFPTREALVTCAIAHLAEQRAREIRTRAAAFARGEDDLESVLALMWSAFSGPLFHAALELWVAARSDEKLHRALHPMERAMGRGMHALWKELLRGEPAGAERAQRLRDLVALTQHLLRGMALQRILQPADTDRARLFDQWKSMARRELRRTARSRR